MGHRKIKYFIENRDYGSLWDHFLWGQSKHKIRTFVVGWICRNLRAFWEDQTDQKSAMGGPKQILRTGLEKDIFSIIHCYANIYHDITQ